MGNTGQVGDNGFDSVTFALDLGHQTFHLVAIERVGNIPTNIDGSHDCGLMKLI